MGVAAPQGSKSAFVRNGRAIITEGKGPGRQSHAMWRQAVATAARDFQQANGITPLDGPLQVTLDFILPKPPSKPKWKLWHDRKPDLDKLERSVFDSLSKLVIADDSRIVDCHSRKRYDPAVPPQCRITISELKERT